MHCWTHPISKMGVILSVSWCKCVQVKKRRAPTLLVLDCSVCSAPAPDHLHFGGHCCYSCRAFFRRTIQRMEKIDVVCRWVPSSYAVSMLSTYTVSTHWLHIICLHNIYTRGIQDRNWGLRGLRDLQVLLCLQVREVSASGHEEGALAGRWFAITINYWI